MTRHDLITQHVARWGFRRRGPFEGAQQYADAVIAFLDTRDWAASFEVRLGKPQAEWTAEDVAAFQQHLTRPRQNAGPDPTPRSAMFVEAGAIDCTIDALVALARRSLDQLATELPATAEGLAIFAHAILLDGRLLITTCGSRDRLGVLKMAAQTLPLYGYVLTFDAFAHVVDQISGKATKRDVLTAHVGTRDDRLVIMRPYAVVGRGVQFEAERRDDLHAADHRGFDPYAELFVSVPPVAGPQ